MELLKRPVLTHEEIELKNSEQSVNTRIIPSYPEKPKRQSFGFSTL